MNFPKGMKIGHLEPPIDDLTQIPINSATTQRMLPKTVKLDSFTPPKYQLDATIQQQLDNLLGTFKDQFAKDKTTIWYHTTHTDVNRYRRLRSSFTKTLPRCNETVQLGKGRD